MLSQILNANPGQNSKNERKTLHQHIFAFTRPVQCLNCDFFQAVRVENGNDIVSFAFVQGIRESNGSPTLQPHLHVAKNIFNTCSLNRNLLKAVSVDITCFEMLGTSIMGEAQARQVHAGEKQWVLGECDIPRNDFVQPFCDTIQYCSTVLY